jgi:hypothetical protein
MDQQTNNEGTCTSCGQAIVESSNSWHGQEVCDMCFSVLQVKEKQAGGISKCQECGKEIESAGPVKLWMEKILCPPCYEILRGPRSDPARRMAQSLINISYQLDKNTKYLRFIAGVLAVWLFLSLIGAIVVGILMLSR